MQASFFSFNLFDSFIIPYFQSTSALAFLAVVRAETGVVHLRG